MATTTVGMPDPAPEPQAAVNSFARIVGVILSPSKAFADIVKRPAWLVAMIVMILISLGLSITLAQRADWVQVSKDQIAKSKFASRQFDQMTEQQKAQAFEQTAHRSKIIREVRGVIVWPLLLLFVSAIYFGAFKLLGGIRTNFATAFAVCTFAHLPVAIRELLAIPVNLLRDPSLIDPENFLASNPAAVIGDVSGWSAVPLTALDIFSLWSLALVAIGFSAADPKKVPLGKSFGIAFSVWGSIMLFFTMVAWVLS